MNRKIFKSILVVMLTLLITANITISSKAMGIEQFSNEKVIVNEFIDKYHPGKNYDDIISLYDFNDKISYLLFTLSDSGYVIIDINDKCVVESGTDNNNFIKADTNKYYYNGPFAYFIEKDGMLFDLTSQEYIKEKDLKCVTPKKELDYEVDSSITLYGEVEYGVYLKGTLPNYSYNPNGICGSTAAAMFLRYWDTWHNGNYVPSNLQTSNGEALIKRLVPHIDGSSPGSSPDELKNGIQSYLRSQGVNDYMYSETYGNYRVQERIDNNKPFILGLTNHPTYNEHWVTAYGYFVELGRFKYIIVNNGWGGSGVYINSSYCDYIVY